METELPFVSFEGADKCGKGTQMKSLTWFLRSRKIEYAKTQEPGGTKRGKQIRDILLAKGKEGEKLNSFEQFRLFSTSRSLNVRYRIIPALNQGKVVLTDRFLSSSIVYQGYAGSLCPSWIEAYSMKYVTKGIRPDLVVIIDIPVETVLKRIAKDKDKKKDQFEAKTIDFHRKVCEGYRQIAKDNPNAVLIDGTQSREGVHQQIRKEVSQLLDSPGR